MEQITCIPDLETSILLCPQTAPEHEWWWRTDIHDGTHPVTGGTQQVRTLVSALDGETWLWVTIGCGMCGLWFQVLGTQATCVLELGAGSRLCMVAREINTAYQRPPLPPTCRYWMPYTVPRERFNASDAAEIGITYLTGKQLPEDLIYLGKRLGHPESRNP